MSAPIDVGMFMSNVGQYNENEYGRDTERAIRLATVDSFDNNGLARLIFDGEATATTKGYSWFGAIPRVGSRVLVMPIGATSAILGELNSQQLAQVAAQVVAGPKGVIASTYQTVASSYARNQGWDTGVAAASVSGTLEAGRKYRVGCGQVNLAIADSVPARIGGFLRMRRGSGSWTKIQECQTLANNVNRHDSMPCLARIDNAPAGPIQIDLVQASITSVSGTFGQVRVYADAGMPCEMYIEDLGAV